MFSAFRLLRAPLSGLVRFFHDHMLNSRARDEAAGKRQASDPHGTIRSNPGHSPAAVGFGLRVSSGAPGGAEHPEIPGGKSRKLYRKGEEMNDSNPATPSDKEVLHRFGYAQQLLRDMGGFSNFAISFSIISILTGGITLYKTGLTAGGPVVMGIGWPLVTLFVLFIPLGIAARWAELGMVHRL